MATKSQLKQYFETGKIPTQVQFGELIDFIQPLISDDSGNRPNQTLRFGSDGSQPIINGLRIIHYYGNSDTILNVWLFTNEATGNNQSGISVPVFAISRITDENPGIPSGNDELRYCIPEAEHIQSWVSLGIDCDTASDGDILNALLNWPFKTWPEGGGSEFPRVAYIDSQSAWNTWYNNFKAAHDENETNGKISSINMEGIIIDNCTFIIESQIDINFKSGTDNILFKDCLFQFENTEDSNVNINFSGCRFVHSYISGNCNFQNGIFENCTFDIGTTINNAIIYKSYITANKLYKCNCYYSTICNVSIEDGNVQACDVLHSQLYGLSSSRSKFYSCQIEQLKLRDTVGLVLYGCSILSGALNPFANSTGTVIQGFIWGCDFSNMSTIPGVMQGAQCCKFKSSLLSSGVILADMFGYKSAASNGMNIGV